MYLLDLPQGTGIEYVVLDVGIMTDHNFFFLSAFLQAFVLHYVSFPTLWLNNYETFVIVALISAVAFYTPPLPHPHKKVTGMVPIS